MPGSPTLTATAISTSWTSPTTGRRLASMSGSTRAGEDGAGFLVSSELRDENSLSQAAACPAVCFVFSMPTSTAFWTRRARRWSDCWSGESDGETDSSRIRAMGPKETPGSGFPFAAAL